MATDSKHTPEQLKEVAHALNCGSKLAGVLHLKNFFGLSLSASKALYEEYENSDLEKRVAYEQKAIAEYDQLKEENKILKDLCNEMLGEFDRLRKTYDNVEDLAGVVSRTMYDKARKILSPSNQENNENGE